MHPLTILIVICSLASLVVLACVAIANLKHCHPPRRKPNLKAYKAAAAMLLLCSVSAFAADAPKLFNANEWQLDLNGFAKSPDIKNFTYGGGLGVNYFVTESVGFGLEGQAEDSKSAFFDRIGVSLIGRYPIQKLRLAPEFKVGYDYDFERGGNHGIDLNGHEVFAAIGAEYRLTKSVGFGVEVRGVKPLESAVSEYVQCIGRLRFNF